MKAKPRILFHALKNAMTNLHTLFFLNGFLLCFLVYTYLEDQYEKQTFDSLNAYVLKSFNGAPVNEDTALIRSLHLIYGLETMHRKVFSAASVGGFIARDIRPVSYDFTTGQGACGSSSMVLGRLLLSMQYELRFAQMRVDGVSGGHNVLEVKIHDRWVVVDPLYDLYFVRPDGRMASFEDLHGNWAWYSRQVPQGYNPRYRYEGVVHTNWNKIPVIMPALKSILDVVIGRERADAISLRTLFLRKFHCLFIMLLVVHAVVLSYTVGRLLQRRTRVRRAFSYNYPDAVIQPKTQLLA